MLPGKESFVVAAPEYPQVLVRVVGPVGGKGDGGVEDLHSAGSHVLGKLGGILQHARHAHDLLDLRVQLAALAGKLVLELDEEEGRLGGVYAQTTFPGAIHIDDVIDVRTQFSVFGLEVSLL